MKILSEFGKQQMKKLINQEIKLRNQVWLSFSLIKIVTYYKNRAHRRKCSLCRKVHTRELAKLAGVEL